VEVGAEMAMSTVEYQCLERRKPYLWSVLSLLHRSASLP
jgi:hypothetical protein